MTATIKTLAAGLLSAAGLAATADTATAQFPGGSHPSPGPVVVQPQFGGPAYYPPTAYPGPRSDTHYLVYVKPPFGHQWQLYGKFETYHQAQEIERVLERQGRAVKVEPGHGGRGW